MSTQLSSNTQAILLLTAPLIAGKKEESTPLLKLAEYNRLARLLVTKGKQPADLLAPDAVELIADCEVQFGQGRIKDLLGRGFLLSQAVDRWHSRGIWVISRADAAYPKRLKARLKENAPPILYGCGEEALLELGGLAVVGSRHIDDAMLQYTMNLGAMAAAVNRPIVSGAARGIDSSAMAGALEGGGVVIGVMADSLERAALAVEQMAPLTILMRPRLQLIPAAAVAAVAPLIQIQALLLSMATAVQAALALSSSSTPYPYSLS